jgi:hypothetical protein
MLLLRHAPLVGCDAVGVLTLIGTRSRRAPGCISLAARTRIRAMCPKPAAPFGGNAIKMDSTFSVVAFAKLRPDLAGAFGGGGPGRSARGSHPAHMNAL